MNNKYPCRDCIIISMCKEMCDPVMELRRLGKLFGHNPYLCDFCGTPLVIKKECSYKRCPVCKWGTKSMNDKYPCRDCIIIRVCKVLCPPVLKLRREMKLIEDNIHCMYCGSKLDSVYKYCPHCDPWWSQYARLQKMPLYKLL